MPFCRILKMCVNPEILAPHLRKLRVGDVVQMNGVTDMNSYPTDLKTADGNDRKIYVASAGLIMGYYPSLHWDYKPQPVSVGDTVTAVEG